jgi:hypothetical protein
MEPCEFPRCMKSATLTYVGHAICDHHHELICRAREESRESENAVLSKIGLVRNDQGQVVSTRP